MTNRSTQALKQRHEPSGNLECSHVKIAGYVPGDEPRQEVFTIDISYDEHSWMVSPPEQLQPEVVVIAKSSAVGWISLYKRVRNAILMNDIDEEKLNGMIGKVEQLGEWATRYQAIHNKSTNIMEMITLWVREFTRSIASYTGMHVEVSLLDRVGPDMKKIADKTLPIAKCYGDLRLVE